MTCPNCGSSNLDNASICVNCGRPLSALPPPPPAPAPQPVYTAQPPRPFEGAQPLPAPIPNYLVQSILITLCCCFPLGIVALVFSAQVNSKLAAGDVAGAREASANARKFCWIAVIVGIVAMVVIGVLYGAVLAQVLHAAAERH